MAHFAELDETNIVKQVIVVHNNELLDENGNESEQKGIDFCVNLLGGTWVQTSYNATIRKNYAGIGYLYDPILDVFITPNPYPSWTLNADTCEWEAPILYPTDGKEYYWDEPSLSWMPVPTFPEPNEDWVVQWLTYILILANTLKSLGLLVKQMLIEQSALVQSLHLKQK